MKSILLIDKSKQLAYSYRKYISNQLKGAHMNAMPNGKDRSNMMTLLVNPAERTLLDLICEQDGGASRSSIVRKLIAQEAHRRNIEAPAVVMAPAAGD